ncbi:RNA recognition motif containing protein [Stagonosporopsis vannaccii]|nr:RNA recognition motif containing protein [Stagonosporopsis vannaccii]
MADFASFVKDSREKKKHENLAQQFLGSRSRTATPTSGSGAKSRQTSEKPTLLSRISGGAGIQKGRSSSAKPSGNIDGKWQHDLHKVNNPNGPPARAAKLGRTASASQIDRNSRTYDKFASTLNRNANGRSDSAPGFSIRGVASIGPFTVIASNFAPGTTASDIEAVMAPHGGESLGCKMLTASPTVMVELTFATREGAENVIATFNNQKADGRTLYVYLKEKTTSNAIARSRPPPAHAAQTTDDMEVDGARGGSFQDGRYGFSEGGRPDPPRGPRRRY